MMFPRAVSVTLTPIEIQEMKLLRCRLLEQEDIYEREDLRNLCEDKLVLVDGNMCVTDTKQGIFSDCISLVTLHNLVKPNLSLVPYEQPPIIHNKLDLKPTVPSMPQPNDQTEMTPGHDLSSEKR